MLMSVLASSLLLSLPLIHRLKYPFVYVTLFESAFMYQLLPVHFSTLPLRDQQNRS